MGLPHSETVIFCDFYTTNRQNGGFGAKRFVTLVVVEHKDSMQAVQKLNFSKSFQVFYEQNFLKNHQNESS